MLNPCLPTTCPVIAYHKISDKKEPGLTTIRPSVFENHIRWLSDAGFQSISFKSLQAGEQLPKKPIIIMFDDGYECIFRHAIPVLSAAGFTAVVFIVAGFTGRLNTWEAVKWQQKHRHLDTAQLKELHQMGFEIGSHGLTHRFLPGLSDREIREEAVGSKKFLEDLTGGEILSFCYPYGRYTQRVKRLVGESGYVYGVHNLRLFNHRQQDPLALTRHSIYLSDSPGIFKKKVTRPLTFSTHSLQEILIQKGALLSIVISQTKKNQK